MKKAPLSLLPIAVTFLFPILAIAQIPGPASPIPEQASEQAEQSSGQAGERPASGQTADRPITDWRITEKEVKAVQAELTRRGYYKSKLTGVLDRDTREAVQAYQIDNGLKGSGRIDMETYRSLELPYPATGKEADMLRKNGLAPKIGYGAKDATVNTGGAVTGGAKKIGSGVRKGLEKTWDLGAGTVSKSKELAQGAGGAATRGAKSAGRGAERAGASIIGRSDAEVLEDVRRALEENPETKLWYSDVKNGTVTIKTPRNHNADLGATVSNIRKVPGVKSVFVIVL